MEISENFSYVGPKQNFDRDNYATLAEMKAVSDKNMPSIFLATCEETGKLYIYKKTCTSNFLPSFTISYYHTVFIFSIYKLKETNFLS